MPDSPMSSDVPGSPWWSRGLRFSCVGCGSCCGGGPGTVWFTDEERAAMARSLGVDEFEFDRLYVWRKYGRPSLREASNYDCVFLGGNRDRCMVYESRPAQCGSFPFWPEILKNRQSWDEYSQTCPGMNEGDLHNEEEIARLLSSVL